MIDEPGADSARCEPRNKESNGDRTSSGGKLNQLRIVELRILEIRKEAEAARLEAKAVRLERILRRLTDLAHPPADSASPCAESNNGHASSIQVSPETDQAHGAEREFDSSVMEANPLSAGEVDWNAVIRVLPPELSHQFRLFLELLSPPSTMATANSTERVAGGTIQCVVPETIVSQSAPSQESKTNPSIDSTLKASPRQAGPNVSETRGQGSQSNASSKPEAESTVVSKSVPNVTQLGNSKKRRRSKTVSKPFIAVPRKPASASPNKRRFPKPGDYAVVDRPFQSTAKSHTDQHRSRKPTAGLALSAFVHGAILIALAMVGLQAPPADQLALTATANCEETNPAFHTFEFEPAIPETPESLADSYTKMDVTVEVTSDVSAVASPQSFREPFLLTDNFTARVQPQESESLLLEDPKTTTNFCGVEGGGKHFVYLVDSSKSMGRGFESARQELLRAISLLQADQRFYVVFFDSDSDFMSTITPGKRDEASVFATATNKAAVQRWASKIQPDSGRAPYEPLRFALQLRPDAIFLLSDGEFPQGIEDLLESENQFENLFGERRPISIVHTIGYHSKAGENRMKRIATANAGRYRHVPAPTTSPD
jgi:hypothetical protein